MLSLSLCSIESERRGDQRSEVLDIGAHNDDVARLECGVVSEQADQHLPQHLYLTIGPMAGMELDARVTFAEEWSFLFGRRCSVGCDVGLQPTEQGCRHGGFMRFLMQIHGIRAGRTECDLEFAYVTAEIGEQPMANQCFAGIIHASRHRR